MRVGMAVVVARDGRRAGRGDGPGRAGGEADRGGATRGCCSAGADAEGGIGDWYLSNGVVQAIIDDAGPGVRPGRRRARRAGAAEAVGDQPDRRHADRPRPRRGRRRRARRSSSRSAASRPTSSSSTTPSRAPAPGRHPGERVAQPAAARRCRPARCIGAVTDYAVAEGDPFLTMTTTITNGCAGTDGQLGAFLDAIIWTQRGIVPFSAGAGVVGGRGFDHPILDFANPVGALETPSFVGAPGMLGADDGVMDPANGTVIERARVRAPAGPLRARRRRAGRRRAAGRDADRLALRRDRARS